jgi:hypothetical protein
LQPVAPKTVPASSYNGSITGNRLTLNAVPARVWFEVRATGWAPQGLKTAQIRIDSTGYMGSNAICAGAPANGGDLFPATQSCAANADCRSTISGLASACGSGEPSKCVARPAYYPAGGNICAPGFQDRCDTEWILFGVSGVAAVDTATLNYRWGSTTEPPEVSPDFAPSYLGTLVLDVPANAKGLYTIGYVANETYMTDDTVPVGQPIVAALIPGEVEIPCGSCCVAQPNVHCIDGMSRAECDAMGLLNTFRPGASCTGDPVVDCHGIPPGVDCYRVECGLTELSFGAEPIPGEFFGPGCEPFDGAIFATGRTGGGDLKIRRLNSLLLVLGGPSQGTDIELESLDLVSCEPIVVQCLGVPTEWQANIGRSPPPAPQGRLVATKTHANGGTFTMEYSVLPRLTFFRADNPSDVRILDFAEVGRAPIVFDAVGAGHWVHEATIPMAPPCGENFVPGVEEEQPPSAGMVAANAPQDQCCRKVAAAAPENTGAGGPPGCAECKGACCLSDGTCEVVAPVGNLTARQRCTRATDNGGRGGTYIEDNTNCDDTDGDGIPDVFETNNKGHCRRGEACKRGTHPDDPDTDGDGCPDGQDSAPCDPCAPAGGCTGFADCDGNGIADSCELAGNDCNGDGVLDRCPPGPTGACCNTQSGCAELTKTACDSLPGWVFQGFCTRCPTQNVGTAVHDGVAVVHYPSPVPECSITGAVAAAAAEDCTLRQCLYDTWVTDPNEPTCHNFAGIGEAPAIPADFFGPGSDPFVGQVCFEGLPLGPTPFGYYGDADTIICRSADPFLRCALPSVTEFTVPIQIVALSLVGRHDPISGKPIPIVVTYNGGQNPEFWNVAVGLSVVQSPPGTLTAVKTHCNGGTYTSLLPVRPKFTFTKATPPNTQQVLDTGVLGGWPVFTLVQDPAPPTADPPWIHDPQAALRVVMDPCTNFHPGVEDVNPVYVCDCNANNVRDACDLESLPRSDCNNTGIPDECELSGNDCNSNGVPDDCEPDCNGNGVVDGCDVPPPSGVCVTNCSTDCNANGMPDECEPDCNGNGFADACDIIAGRSFDCEFNGRPDECDTASRAAPDCNLNAVPDTCDLAFGPSADCNTNSIPDECEGIPPSSLQIDPTGFSKSRFISFVPGNPGQETAIRVTLSMLHHVDPPYTAGVSVPFTAFEGQSRWVGPPVQYVESDSSGTPFLASQLRCTPHYQDWSTISLLHVTGSDIVPSSLYDVAVIAAACDTSIGANYSNSLSVITARWGDVETPFAPNGAQPDFTDIGSLVNKFKNAPGAPIKARAMLAGDNANGVVNVTPDVNFGHISACVDAFKGLPYPYKVGKCSNDAIRGCTTNADCVTPGTCILCP